MYKKQRPYDAAYIVPKKDTFRIFVVLNKRLNHKIRGF